MINKSQKRKADVIMYIVFIDESGQPGGYNEQKQEFNTKSSKYFVLAGFMIDGNELVKIQQRLDLIKLKYGLSKEIEAKWNSSYKALGMELDTYIKYRREILELISEYKNSVVGIAMNKEKCYKSNLNIKNQNDLYAFALNLLMERFCMEVTDRNGRDTCIPVILFTDSRKNDRNSKLDKELQISYRRAKNMGTKYIGFPNFSESLVFIDSEYSSGIQLADFCAGSIFKYFEEENDTYVNMIKNSIRNHNGKINGVGLKEFIK